MEKLEAWQNTTKYFTYIGIWGSAMTVLLLMMPRLGGYNKEVAGIFSFLLMIFWVAMEVKVRNKKKVGEENDESKED